jgi:uncharacterized phage-associated protein
MPEFKIDISKAKAVILYIANKFGETDFHKVFKMLYIAEKDHLAQYGRPIVGDTYMAMKYGPVPSFIYDAFKAIRGDGYRIPGVESFYRAFEVQNKYSLIVKEKADMDELSESDIRCLDAAIDENKNLDFQQLSDMSHDEAWKGVERDDAMDIIAIAKSGGADEEMIKYIIENQEYRNIAFA